MSTMHTETSGALSSMVIAALRTHEKYGKENFSDTTPYGASRSSHKTYFAHHFTALSEGIVDQDAISILNDAITLEVLAAHGLA